MAHPVKRILAIITLFTLLCAGYRFGRDLAFTAGRHPLHVLQRAIAQKVQTATSVIPSTFTASLQDANTDAPPADVFESVLDHVQREFVEGNNSDARLTNGALSRMLASLDDPKTDYLEPALRQARQDALLGRTHGIGAFLTVSRLRKDDIDYRYLTVVDVVPGSPAEKAGLQPGDRITGVNGHWVIAYSVLADYDRIIKEHSDEATKKSEADDVAARFQKGLTVARALPLLLTGENKSLDLAVERPDRDGSLKIVLTTAGTEVDPVEFRMVGDRVAYLRVRQFNPRATEEFQSAMEKAVRLARSVIVDLRGNPGGVRSDARSGVDGYDSALKLVGLLTKGGTVASFEARPNQRAPLVIHASEHPLMLPLVVLVDHGTANISELVAVALRDAGKAKLIGAHTFGDDVLQLFAVLKNGAAVEINSGRMMSASGADLSRGIDPGIAVPEAAGKDRDAALQRALTELGV